jgi:hypothetical protein
MHTSATWQPPRQHCIWLYDCKKVLKRQSPAKDFKPLEVFLPESLSARKTSKGSTSMPQKIHRFITQLCKNVEPLGRAWVKIQLQFHKRFNDDIPTPRAMHRVTLGVCDVLLPNHVLGICQKIELNANNPKKNKKCQLYNAKDLNLINNNAAKKLGRSFYLKGRGVRIPSFCGCLNLNQTADLVGEVPLRLIGEATNEWLISLGAAPHESLDTRCEFLNRNLSCCC